MISNNLYPLRLTPVLKEAIWGGWNLSAFGREIPQDKRTAESWEIAAHSNGMSLIRNGLHAGKNLAELTLELGLDLVGERGQWALDRGKFPLLVKLIDANDRLSVQVHPRDEYARQHEGNELGKTEMWVVLKAKPQAQLIYGVTHGTTPESFRAGLVNGHLEPYLNFIPIKAGDHVCVPAGTLHAIMDGEIIAEIQQNSDTTYRVYDWNRVGNDGKPRELHIEKALDVIDFEHPEPGITPPQLLSDVDGVQQLRLCQNEYFITDRIDMQPGTVFDGNCDGTTLEIWGCIGGEIELENEKIREIEFVLLPANMGSFEIKAKTNSTLLRTYLPER